MFVCILFTVLVVLPIDTKYNTFSNHSTFILGVKYNSSRVCPCLFICVFVCVCVFEFVGLDSDYLYDSYNRHAQNAAASNVTDRCKYFERVFFVYTNATGDEKFWKSGIFSNFFGSVSTCRIKTHFTNMYISKIKSNVCSKK